eukprot:2500486-Rhodomonas_salina.1
MDAVVCELEVDVPAGGPLDVALDPLHVVRPDHLPALRRVDHLRDAHTAQIRMIIRPQTSDIRLQTSRSMYHITHHTTSHHITSHITHHITPHITSHIRTHITSHHITQHTSHHTTPHIASHTTSSLAHCTHRNYHS